MESLSNFLVYCLLFLTMYFEVFLLVTYLEEKDSFRLTEARERMPGKYPTVTIIVPAWNEGKTLTNTVNSLLGLDYPKDRLTLFLIDDGSTDDTLSIAKQFEGHPQVQIFSKENGGKYTALNLGLSQCTSDLVGCLDADSFVHVSALKEIIPYFDNAEVMAVIPSVQIHKPNNILQKFQSTEYAAIAFAKKIFSRLNGLYVTPGPFPIYRRSVFERIGTFVHAHGTEDLEMALRMQSHRMKIENAHTALVYTVAPSTPRALYTQRVRWSTGFLKNTIFSYRFMLFNKHYGNLGFLILPISFFAIFSATFFSVLYLKSLMKLGYEKYIEYSAIGFYNGFHLPGLDWFAFNLEFRTLLVYILFFTVFFFIFMGIRMARSRFVFSVDILYFIFLYGIIAPFWLVRSLYNLVTAKEANWR